MKQSEPDPIFEEGKKPNEKTPILDKMNPSFNYSEFSDDSSKTEKPCCSCISVLCCCELWYHVLMFILFPWAIYHYWVDIVNWYYGFWYEELPLKAMEPDMGPMVKRLRNLGNTCFYNSMNQSINQTVLLHEMLTDCYAQSREYVIKPEQFQDEELIIKCNTNLGNLTKEAHDLYCREIAMPLGHIVVPRKLLREISYRNPRFGRRKEEDSHEALRCLLDGFRMEEIDKIKDQIYAHFGVSKDPESHQNLDGENRLKLKVYLREATKLCLPVDRVFGGVHVSTTICRECYTPLQNKEKFFDMSLPLPEHTAETIDAFRYRPPVIDKHHIKKPLQAEADKEGKKSDHDKRQDEVKESLEGLLGQTHDTIINEDSNPLIVNPAESEHDSESDNKPGKDNASSNKIILGYEVDDNHDASKEDDKSGGHVPEAEAAESLDPPTTQLKEDDQVTNVDGVNNSLDADIEIMPPEELPSGKVPLEEKVNGKKDLTDVNLSTDDHQKPNPDVALNKHELHKYLESKGLQYQMLPEVEKEQDPQRLESLLTEYTDLDILDENNKFICEICTKNRNKPQEDDDDDNLTLSLVSKQIAIHRLPPVLILHMKRFKIEPDSISKDTQHIEFPLKLNMAPYCTTECIKEMGDRNQEIWYGLYAVVVHDGGTLEHGHYYAYVRRRPPVRSSEKPQGEGWIYDQNAADSGCWFYASDLTVRFCDQGFEEVRRQRAYMLFYELLPDFKNLRLT